MVSFEGKQWSTVKKKWHLKLTIRLGLLEAWLVLTSAKYHRNV